MQSKIIFFRNSNKNYNSYLQQKKKRSYVSCSSSSQFFLKNENYSAKNDNFIKYQIDHESKKLIRGSLSSFPSEKEKFRDSKCLIPLSIGQAAHYGSYLAATLDRVDNSFSACTFLLGDTLQRNTLPLLIGNEFDDDFFYQKTLREGNDWIEKNAHILALLKIPYSVVRWDYWLNHKKFKLAMAETENLYEHDNFFKEVVERNIEDYIDRLKIRNELILSEEIAKNFCLKYILEECASMRLWTELQCNYDLYPNKRSQAMEYIYEKFIKTEQTGLLKPLAIRFKKKEIPKELRFENRIEIQEANLQFNSESQALLKRI